MQLHELVDEVSRPQGVCELVDQPVVDPAGIASVVKHRRWVEVPAAVGIAGGTAGRGLTAVATSPVDLDQGLPRPVNPGHALGLADGGAESRLIDWTADLELPRRAAELASRGRTLVGEHRERAHASNVVSLAAVDDSRGEGRRICPWPPCNAAARAWPMY